MIFTGWFVFFGVLKFLVVLEPDIPVGIDHVSNKVTVNLDVFSTFMEDGIGSYMNGGVVVTIDDGGSSDRTM